MLRKKSLAKALKKLRENFESRDILDAVGHLDEIRPIISDDDFRPPEIRDRLLKLHREAMELINYTGSKDKERLDAVLDKAEEIDSEVFDCMENLDKIRTILTKLLDLGGYDPD